LLVYRDKKILSDRFFNLADYLPEASLLIFNNTRVIPARLYFRKNTGAEIEVFLLEPLFPADYRLGLGAGGSCEWKCMVGNLKKWKGGNLEKQIETGNEKTLFSAQLSGSAGNVHCVKFQWDNPRICFAEILASAGELPIPPYLHRKTEESDKSAYQTVYSKSEGSVAAPTAGLHFTEETQASLSRKNIETEELTLHVGAGTFQPVKSDEISEHRMHAESMEVKKSTIEHLLRKLGNITAVGTTSVRTLESLYYTGVNIQNNADLDVQQWQAYENDQDISTEQALQNILNYLDSNNMESLCARTRIMIRPGFRFRMVNAMITNFHQPRSTLLLLVSAFVNGNWKNIYDYALQNDFRFLSYGDSSVIFREA
jgi:S-adenosylmethionine:tRNA ribosyltransferase-isomerase